ncbi:MAG: glycosyltransferase family 4 protein [Microthrixaceae bacterium]
MSDAGSEPFSVTLVTQYFPPESGAAQVRLGAIVADMAARGHHVDVVTSVPNYPLGRIFPGWSHRPLQVELAGQVKIHRVWVWAAMGSGPGRMLNYLSFGVMSILGIASTPRSDWVLVEYPTLIGALPAVVIGRLRRQRVALIVADLWVDSIAEIGTIKEGAIVRALRKVERWMFRRADVVTAVTGGVRDALVRKGVDADRLAWLPNGADIEMFAPGTEDPNLRGELGIGDDEHIVLYAGTHGYVHGLEVVLDAAELLNDVPVRFVLVGAGSEKDSLQADAARRGLVNVIFHEPVQPEQVAKMLRSATAGLATVRRGDVYKSIRSAKMLPSMSSGCPVIYSGDDEGSRLISEAGAGLVTDPGDGKQLADAVRRLIDDPQLRRELGDAGRRWILEKGSWHKLVGDWLGELNGAANRSSKATAGHT